MERKSSKWKSSEGYYLAAGGILLLEDDSAWVVVEHGVYTDIGGRYDFNDGDIYATISREFREELYNTAEISYFDVRNVPANKRIYVNSYYGTPIYMCIVVHRKDIPIRGVLSNDAIQTAKNAVIYSNKRTLYSNYTTDEICLVPLDVLRTSSTVSPRLKEILKQL